MPDCWLSREADYFAALTAATGWQVDGTTLTIIASDADRTLTFEA